MPSYAPRMADVPQRAGLGRPALIAICFAVVALVTSLIAVVVVMRRSKAPAVVAVPKNTRVDRTIDANDVTKLKRDVVEKAVDERGDVIGVTVKDAAVRTALGLEAGDIITAINGRAIKREFDVYDAVLGMSMMDASIVYLEVLRGKEPSLVRWKLDGELRQARNGPSRRPPPATSNPFTASPDPLVDSIRRIDELHYEVPRATIDQMLANPDRFARQARIVPSIRNGQPDGFKLYAIQTGSFWFAIGLENGDTIRSVNGHDLSTPDKALELYQKVKGASELRILVGRRDGTEETIAITVK